MYDPGGINLKPSDASHSQMKNDMSGAGAVLAAMTALREVGCRSRVTAYLMCTDNMPSGSAVQLGDVLVTRNGTTVEVMNTDAEGRLVMCDALALCVEDGVDAIVDIATLTGACLRALGTEVARVLGNSPRLVDLVRSAGEATDEPVWELPLIRRYRSQLDSTVADMTNLGGPYAGSITAGLYLEHFVDGTPGCTSTSPGRRRSRPAPGGCRRGRPDSVRDCWWSWRRASTPGSHEPGDADPGDAAAGGARAVALALRTAGPAFLSLFLVAP